MSVAPYKSHCYEEKLKQNKGWDSTLKGMKIIFLANF